METDALLDQAYLLYRSDLKMFSNVSYTNLISKNIESNNEREIWYRDSLALVEKLSVRSQIISYIFRSSVKCVKVHCNFIFIVFFISAKFNDRTMKNIDFYRIRLLTKYMSKNFTEVFQNLYNKM